MKIPRTAKPLGSGGVLSGGRYRFRGPSRPSQPECLRGRPRNRHLKVLLEILMRGREGARAREKRKCHECLETPEGLGVQELLWVLAGSPLPNFSMSLGFWKAVRAPRLGSFPGDVETLWYERKASVSLQPPRHTLQSLPFLLGEGRC